MLHPFLYIAPKSEHMPQSVIAYLTAMGITFAGLLAVYWILIRLSKRWDDHVAMDLEHTLSDKLKVPVFVLVVILSLWLPLYFAEVPEQIHYPVNKALTIGLILVISWSVIRLVKLVKYIILRRYDIDQKDNLQARKVYTQFRILERIANFLVVVIAVALILMSFAEIRKIGVSLIASAGVTGIILGLAAQKLIGGMLAGLQLAFTQPIRLDDVVIVENEWGRIEEINLTYVVVRIWDNRRLVLPSTYFIEQPFQNWTMTNSDILGTVFIYTDYTVSFQAIREELDRLLENNELWDGKVKVMQVTNATDKAVEVRLLISATDSGKAWDLRVLLREKMIEFIQENYPESLPKTRVQMERERVSTPIPTTI